MNWAPKIEFSPFRSAHFPVIIWSRLVHKSSSNFSRAWSASGRFFVFFFLQQNWAMRGEGLENVYHLTLGCLAKICLWAREVFITVQTREIRVGKLGSSCPLGQLNLRLNTRFTNSSCPQPEAAIYWFLHQGDHDLPIRLRENDQSLLFPLRKPEKCTICVTFSCAPDSHNCEIN